MKFSKFGKRFSGESGIYQLMEDLGSAMAGDTEMLMLGGGNPAHIPEVERYFQERMQWFMDNPKVYAQIFGDYDAPQGEGQFIRALAELLKRQYGWQVGPENIALTAGSQSGFFLLFNTFAGEFDEGINRKILLPMAPEYIGYSDVGLSDNFFTAQRPAIEKFADRSFKYHVDFDQLEIGDDIGAICVSRPTNPTGNVLSDSEVSRLLELANQHDIPFIIDSAYGMPFPDIIFTEANPVWTEQIVLCMSLSKLGLPGARTGIIIAHKEITKAIARMNGIINLALGSFGPALVLALIKTGDVIKLSHGVIRPYYKNKAKRAVALCHQELAGVDYYIHKAEGALFLWLWFPGLPITSKELYQRLKQRGVLVLSGHYFFPGLEQDSWRHKDECLRVSYAMDDAVVSEGIKIIADEVKKIFTIHC